jgi:LPXTG-site transpeptidase (sortase) family protein
METHQIVLAASPTPQVPETSLQEESLVTFEETVVESIPDPKQLLSALTKGDDYPARLIIPSISLDANVLNMGINEKGEMDVPDGKSKDVGWYEKGTIPGEVGSAVIDAHVYAAFKKLRYVKVGDDIYVVTKTGEKRHFRVADSRVYKLGNISPDWLFNRADDRRLNLITCAGQYMPKLATYEKRLIVEAILVDESA